MPDISGMLSTSVFMYFKEYSDTEQSLTYPSEKVGEDCWYCCNPNGVYDIRGGLLELIGTAYHSCH
jgi:hypothetical protein